MYHNMFEILEDGKVGDFELSHFEIGEKDFIAMYRMGISAGRYVKLSHKGKCVMSDTDMEKRTNSSFVINAHGKVLIGGLGIGLILLAVQDKAEVEKITVIEKKEKSLTLWQVSFP